MYRPKAYNNHPQKTYIVNTVNPSSYNSAKYSDHNSSISRSRLNTNSNYHTYNPSSATKITHNYNTAHNSRRSSYDIQPTKVVKDDFNTPLSSYEDESKKVYTSNDFFSQTQPNFSSHSIKNKETTSNYISNKPGQYFSRVVKKPEDSNPLIRPSKLSITNERDSSVESMQSNVSVAKSSYSLQSHGKKTATLGSHNQLSVNPKSNILKRSVNTKEFDGFNEIPDNISMNSIKTNELKPISRKQIYETVSNYTGQTSYDRQKQYFSIKRIDKQGGGFESKRKLEDGHTRKYTLNNKVVGQDIHRTETNQNARSSVSHYKVQGSHNVSPYSVKNYGTNSPFNNIATSGSVNHELSENRSLFSKNDATPIKQITSTNDKRDVLKETTHGKFNSINNTTRKIVENIGSKNSTVNKPKIQYQTGNEGFGEYLSPGIKKRSTRMSENKIIERKSTKNITDQENVMNFAENNNNVLVPNYVTTVQTDENNNININIQTLNSTERLDTKNSSKLAPVSIHFTPKGNKYEFFHNNLARDENSLASREFHNEVLSAQKITKPSPISNIKVKIENFDDDSSKKNKDIESSIKKYSPFKKITIQTDYTSNENMVRQRRESTQYENILTKNNDSHVYSVNSFGNKVPSRRVSKNSNEEAIIDNEIKQYDNFNPLSMNYNYNEDGYHIGMKNSKNSATNMAEPAKSRILGSNDASLKISNESCNRFSSKVLQENSQTNPTDTKNIYDSGSYSSNVSYERYCPLTSKETNRQTSERPDYCKKRDVHKMILPLEELKEEATQICDTTGKKATNVWSFRDSESNQQAKKAIDFGSNSNVNIASKDDIQEHEDKYDHSFPIEKKGDAGSEYQLDYLQYNNISKTHNGSDIENKSICSNMQKTQNLSLNYVPSDNNLEYFKTKSYDESKDLKLILNAIGTVANSKRKDQTENSITLADQNELLLNKRTDIPNELIKTSDECRSSSNNTRFQNKKLHTDPNDEYQSKRVNNKYCKTGESPFNDKDNVIFKDLNNNLSDNNIEIINGAMEAFNSYRKVKENILFDKKDGNMKKMLGENSQKLIESGIVEMKKALENIKSNQTKHPDSNENIKTNQEGSENQQKNMNYSTPIKLLQNIKEPLMIEQSPMTDSHKFEQALGEDLMKALKSKKIQKDDFFTFDSPGPENIDQKNEQNVSSHRKFLKGLNENAKFENVLDPRNENQQYNQNIIDNTTENKPGCYLRKELVRINPHFTSSEIDVIEYEYNQYTHSKDNKTKSPNDDSKEYRANNITGTQVIEDELNNQYGGSVSTINFNSRENKNQNLHTSDNTQSLSPINQGEHEVDMTKNNSLHNQNFEIKSFRDREKKLHIRMKELEERFVSVSHENDQLKSNELQKFIELQQQLITLDQDNKEIINENLDLKNQLNYNNDELIQNLKEINYQLNEKIDELSLKNSELCSIVKKQEAENNVTKDELKKQRKSFESKSVEFQQNLKKKDDEIKNQTGKDNEISVTNLSSGDRESQVKILQKTDEEKKNAFAMIDDLKIALEQRQYDYTQLEEQLLKNNDDNVFLKQEIETYKKDRDEFTNQFDGVKLDCDNLQNEKANLEEDNYVLRDIVDKFKDELNTYKKIHGSNHSSRFNSPDKPDAETQLRKLKKKYEDDTKKILEKNRRLRDKLIIEQKEKTEVRDKFGLFKKEIKEYQKARDDKFYSIEKENENLKQQLRIKSDQINKFVETNTRDSEANNILLIDEQNLGHSTVSQMNLDLDAINQNDTELNDDEEEDKMKDMYIYENKKLSVLLSHRTQEAKDLNTTIVDLTNVGNELKDVNINLNSDITKQQTELMSDLKTIKELQDYNAVINSQNKDLEAQFEGLQKIVNVNHLNRISLENQLLNSQKEIESLKEERNDFENLNSVLNTKNAELESLIMQKDNKTIFLEEKNLVLQNENFVYEESQNFYSQEMQQAINDKEQESNSKIMNLEQSLSVIKDTTNDYERKYMQNMTEFNNLKEELNNMYNQNYELKEQIARIKSNNISLEASIKQKDITIKNYEVASDQFNTMLQEKEDFISEQNSEIEQIKSTLSLQTDKIDELNVLIKQKDVDYENSNKYIQGIEVELQEYKAQTNSLNNNQYDLYQNINKLKNDNMGLMSIAENSKKENDELSYKIKILKLSEEIKSQDIENLKNKNFELEGQIKEGKQKSDQEIKLKALMKEQLIEELENLNVKFNTDFLSNPRESISENEKTGSYKNSNNINDLTQSEMLNSPMNDLSELNTVKNNFVKKSNTEGANLKPNFYRKSKNLHSLIDDKIEFIDDLEEVKKINDFKKKFIKSSNSEVHLKNLNNDGELNSCFNKKNVSSDKNLATQSPTNSKNSRKIYGTSKCSSDIICNNKEFSNFNDNNTTPDSKFKNNYNAENLSDSLNNLDLNSKISSQELKNYLRIVEQFKKSELEKQAEIDYLKNQNNRISSQLQQKNQEIARINLDSVNNNDSKKCMSKSPNFSSKFTEEKAYSNSNVSNFCFSPNDFNNVKIEDCNVKYSQIYKTVEKKNTGAVDKFSEERNFNQILKDFESNSIRNCILYDQKKIDDLIANQKIINQLNLDPKIKDEMRLNAFREKIQALNSLENAEKRRESDSKFSFGSDEKAILVIGSDDNRGSEIDYLTRKSLKQHESSSEDFGKLRSNEIIKKNLQNQFNANNNLNTNYNEEIQFNSSTNLDSDRNEEIYFNASTNMNYNEEVERITSKGSEKGGSKEETEIELELTKSEFEENN